MRQIAEISGGRSFSASSEDELRQIYSELREQVGFEVRQIDVSKPWFAGGTLATMLCLGSALAFGRRIP